MARMVSALWFVVAVMVFRPVWIIRWPSASAAVCEVSVSLPALTFSSNMLSCCDTEETSLANVVVLASSAPTLR